MKEDCFEISFKDGCDKPVHFILKTRYSYPNVEKWDFYSSTKKVDGDSYYVYKNKKTKKIFNDNIEIIVSEITKQINGNNTFCFIDNKNDISNDICDILSKYNNVFFYKELSNFEIEDKKIDISGISIIIINTKNEINFLTYLLDNSGFSGVPKNVFFISINNASETIRRITNKPKYIKEQPDNEIWYKTNDGEKIKINIPYWGIGRNKIVSHEYGKIRFKYKVREIRSSLFVNNFNLIEMSLPKTIKHIRSCAFDKCWNLEKINFPDNIEYIDMYAFFEVPLCDDDLELCLPKKLKVINNSAFSTSSRVLNIVVYGGLKNEIDKCPCFHNTGNDYSTVYVSSKISKDGLKRAFFLFPAHAYAIFDEKTKQILKIIHTEYGDRRI